MRKGQTTEEIRKVIARKEQKSTQYPVLSGTREHTTREDDKMYRKMTSGRYGSKR